MHLEIEAPGCVLGRRRRTDDGGVDDGPRADSDAAVAQIPVTVSNKTEPKRCSFELSRICIFL